MWLLSDNAFFIQVDGVDYMPGAILVAGPLCAAFILLYLSLAGQRLWRRVAVLVASMAVLSAYVFLLYPRIIPYAFEEQYLTLAAIHLPLVAYLAIGLYLLWHARNADNRFAFLIKSLEAIILGGLFGIALGVFTGDHIRIVRCVEHLPIGCGNKAVCGGRRRHHPRTCGRHPL